MAACGRKNNSVIWLDEIIREGNNVLFALPQRRDVELDDVQPEEKVPAEAALGHQFCEVMVGGGNGAEIDVDQGITANPL